MLMERRPTLSAARCEAVVAGTVLDQNGQPLATRRTQGSVHYRLAG